MRRRFFFPVCLLGCAGASDSGPASSGGDGTVVTIGVYQQDASGAYVAAGVDPLVFEVGPPCQAWSRLSSGHDAQGNLDAVEGSHEHFNAADDTSYEGGDFTWTEHGPEHTLADAEETCAAGAGGVTKTVNATDYYEDKPGIYLRIDAVDEG